MVFLTITSAILEALEEAKHLNDDATQNMRRSHAGQRDLAVQHSSNPDPSDGTDSSLHSHDSGGHEKICNNGKGSGLVEPSLESPELGSPISHGQIIDLWKDLQARGIRPRTLDSLLKGSRVYNPPPKPKPEPTSEYKALMAKLRREEEERSYHQMTHPELAMDTFAQRLPLSSAAHAFASSHQPIGVSDPDGDDEVTYADVNRQVTLILNILVSIVACAGAIWVVAKWWSTPARLAVSLGGSLLVGVAEVVVYSGYIRRVSEAKSKEKAIMEVKEVVNTWIVGAGEVAPEDEAVDLSTSIDGNEKDSGLKSRRRKKDAK